MAVELGKVRKKKKDTILDTVNDVNAKHGASGSISTINTGINTQSPDDNLNQQLTIKREQADQIDAANKAKDQQKQLDNRNWFEKAVGYDPSSNVFMNTLNAVFSPLNWADTTIFSGLNAAQDTITGMLGGGFDYDDVSQPFDQYWNQAKVYGGSDYITNAVGKGVGLEKGLLHGDLAEAKRNVKNRAKTFDDTALSKTTGGKILGFAGDLASPSQIILDMTGVGEAEAAAKIAGTAADKGLSAASKVSKVSKSEKGVKDLEKVNEAIGKAGGGLGKYKLSDLAEEEQLKGLNLKHKYNLNNLNNLKPEKLAEEAKAAEGVKGVAKHVEKTGIEAVAPKHFDSVINHIKSTGTLPESLKGNHTWEAIAEHGKKMDYSKNWKNGAKWVNGWHSAGSAKGLHNTEEYARHMRNFANGSGTKLKSIEDAVKNDKGFINGKSVHQVHAAHQAMDWIVNGPLKAIMGSKNVVAKGLEKYGKSGKAGSKFAKAASKTLRPFKYGGVSLLNRNKNLSDKTIASLNQTEHAKNMIKEKYGKELHNYSHNINNTSKLIKRIVEGKETKETLDKLEKTKGGEQIVKQAREIASKSGVAKGLKEKFENVDKLHSEGKDSLKKVLDKISLPKKDGAKLVENSYSGKALKADLHSEASKYKKEIETIKKADKTLSKEDAEKILIKRDPKYEIIKEYFDKLDQNRNITSLRNNALTDAYHKLKHLKNYSSQNLDGKIEDMLSQVQSAGDWSRVPKVAKEAITEKYRPLHQLIDNYGRDGENTFGRDYLEHETKSKPWAVYRKLQDLSNDKSDFLDKVHRQVVAKTAEVDINDLDKLSPKIRDLHNLDAIDNVKSGYARAWIDQYLSTALSGHENRKTYQNSVLSSLLHLGDKGKYELADRGTLKSTQDKMLTQKVNELTGKKLSPTQAYKEIDNVQKKANEIRSTQLYNYISEIKKGNPNISEYDAESHARELLNERDPKLAEHLNLADELNAEIERVSDYGSKNTESFVKSFDKHILGSQIEKKASDYENSLREYAKDFVKKNTDDKINTYKKQLKEVQEKINNAKSDITKEKYQKNYDDIQESITKLKDNPQQMEDAINAIMDNGTKDRASVTKYKEELLSNNYRLHYQTDAGTGRATPYRARGRILQLLPKGKNVLSNFYKNLTKPEVQEALIKSAKDKNIGSDAYKLFEKELGLDKEGANWLTGEQTFDSFGRISDSDAKDFASITGNYRIASLQKLKNEIVQTNNGVVHDLAEKLGIDPTTIDASPLWYRAIAEDTYSRGVLSNLDIGTGNSKKATDIPNLKKLYEKTLSTKAIDTNMLFGDTFMQMDPIHNIADKLSLTHQQFELHNILSAGIDSGDIAFVSNEKATQHFAGLEQAKVRSKKARLTSPYINTNEVIPLPGNKFLVSTKSILDSLQTLGNVFSKDSLDKLQQSMVEKANIFIPKDISGGKGALEKTYMSVPNQLYTMITQHKAIFNPENNDIHNIFSWAYKNVLRGWKKITLTTPGYAIRNGITTIYNHFLAGLPVAKSALERGKAYKDLAAYRGITNQFTKNVTKKGIVHLIEDERKIISESTKESKKAITNSQILDRLKAKGKITDKQHRVAQEILDLENRGIVGGIRVHADAGHLINTQQVLANKYVKDIAKISKNKFNNFFKKMYALTIGGLTDGNMRLAAWQDDAARLATYRMLDKDSVLMGRLGYESAEEGTRFINLDYQNMTNFEKTKMRWFMPFYAYSRQSFAMHLANFLTNPARYGKINTAIQNSYNDYGENIDPNGVPQWIRDEMYLPFGEGDQVGILKPDLPYQDIIDGYNMLVGGATNFHNPDKFDRANLSASSKNMVGKLNPLLKAMFETAGGKSLYSDQTNDGNWYKALWDEFGGIFSKIPNMVQNALNSGDSSLVDNLLDNLTSMSKHYEKSKLKTQRINQLIDYINEELAKHVGYQKSVQRIKGEMYGNKPQHFAFRAPTVKRYSKVKKKKYRDLAHQI